MGGGEGGVCVDVSVCSSAIMYLTHTHTHTPAC